MKRLRWLLLLLALLVGAALVVVRHTRSAPRFVSYVVSPRRVQLYYRDERGGRFGSIGRLRAWLAGRGQQLVFAMNGGMYAPGGVPKGLLVQQQRVVVPLDTGSGPGNFYLQPNGVFYLTTRWRAHICATSDFPADSAVAEATQSGPLLLVQGAVNPLFTKGSPNVVVRNGVGVLPDGRTVFVLSREPVNFYDFAAYFRDLGCTQALYLDGYVSRLYLPAQGWRQTDGDFGVIIGVAEPVE